MESSPQDRNVAENVTSKEADERVSGTTTNKDAASDKMKTEVKKESKKRKKSNSSSARRRVKKKREEATHITGYALFASTVDQRIMTQSAIEYAWQQKSQSERKMWDQEATRIRQRKLRREKGADAYQWFNPSTMNTSTHLALLSHTLTHTGEELKEKEKVRAQQQEGPIRHDSETASGSATERDDGVHTMLDGLLSSLLTTMPMLVGLLAELRRPGEKPEAVVAIPRDTYGSVLADPLLLPNMEGVMSVLTPADLLVDSVSERVQI
eukprot:m.459851 g.459851  ORF g.459851 m.459851 type:complete len:267 (+) comp21585_c0_seq8:242-1042(+)